LYLFRKFCIQWLTLRLETLTVDLLSLLFGKPVPAINALELNEKLKNGKRPLVLDVRQPDEYRSGHIVGAKLVPLHELGRRMKELPQNREIVCVCASGSRSGSAARMLMGAEDVQHDLVVSCQDGAHAFDVLAPGDIHGPADELAAQSNALIGIADQNAQRASFVPWILLNGRCP
jgi:rhodanese-related sulfurtransferase